jgi:hypothetical protein
LDRKQVGKIAVMKEQAKLVVQAHDEIAFGEYGAGHARGLF